MFIQAKSPKITGVVSFTALYLVGFIALTVFLGRYEFFLGISLQVLLTIGVFIAHRKVSYAVPMLWTLSIWGGLNLIANHLPITDGIEADYAAKTVGHLLVWGESINFDKCVHVYGFAVATWFSWQTLCNIIHIRYQRRLMPSFGLLLIVMASSIGYGTIVELVEFLSSALFTFDKINSYENAGFDMLANSIGAAIAAVIIRLRNL